MPAASECTGRNRYLAPQILGIRHTTDVPQLQEDLASTPVDGFGYLAPPVDLRAAPYPRRIGIPDALRRHGRGLGQNQTRGCPLAVIAAHQVVRDTAGRGTVPRDG